MTKPTLQEIADLPHTQAVAAMREHYDPQWPMVTEDPDEIVDCYQCENVFRRADLIDAGQYGQVCEECKQQIDDWDE